MPHDFEFPGAANLAISQEGTVIVGHLNATFGLLESTR